MGIRSQGDSTSKYNAVWAGTGTGAIKPFVGAPATPGVTDATGGNIVATPGNGWKYHVFTSPGSFDINWAGPADNYCQVLLVAGGGNGGGDGAGGGCGGGGAGGVIIGTLTGLPASSYAVTIGAQNPNGNGLPGNNSTLVTDGGTYTAYGGGRGGAAPAGATDGGSGGGGASGSPGSGGGGAQSVNQSTPYGVLAGKGKDGAYGGGPGSPRVGGGGGGAGEKGFRGNVDGPESTRGPALVSCDGTGGCGYPVGWAAGGDLPTMPTDWKDALGSWGHYAGGGGGSRQSPITDDKNGGYGGGGAGSGVGTGNDAINYTGGGGGGGNSSPSPGSNGGAGAAGMCVIRYYNSVIPTTPFTATGGDQISIYEEGGNTYKSHIFLSPGTFVVADDVIPSVEYLVVAGGGGGGGASPTSGHGGGGGGAGGMRLGSSPGNVATGTYTITIGHGGAGAYAGSPTRGGDGADSAITGSSSLTGTGSPSGFFALAGGGGGTRNSAESGGPGGSGGGATTSGSAGNGNPQGYPAPQSEGNPGGANPPSGGAGCGGGGAGGPGPNSPNGPSPSGCPGGIGKACTYAYGPTNPVIYAGGGAGGGHDHGVGGVGGPGGGGDGGDDQIGSSPYSRAFGRTGRINTGGGGGGGGGGSGSEDTGGGRGAPGIIVLRYQI